MSRPDKQPEKEIEQARSELKQFWPTLHDGSMEETPGSRERMLGNRSPLAYRIMTASKEVVRCSRIEWGNGQRKAQIDCEMVSDAIFDAMLKIVK